MHGKKILIISGVLRWALRNFMGHTGTSDFSSLVDYVTHDEYEAHFAFLPKWGVEPVFAVCV
jgi:hypothetical protein